MDFKYDILKHPNVKLTADGGQPPYIHGEPTRAVATLVFDGDIPKEAVTPEAVSTSYELLGPMRTWKKYSIYKEDLPMKLFKKNENSQNKTAETADGRRNGRRAFAVYAALVCCMVFSTTTLLPPTTRLPWSTIFQFPIFGLIKAGRHDYARLRHRAGGLVAEIHDPSQGERFPYPCGWCCDYLCKGEIPDTHYWADA